MKIKRFKYFNLLRRWRRLKMPNWTSCDLKIRSPDKEKEHKELKRFKAFAQTTKDGEVNSLDTNKFIPYPEKFKKQDEIAAEDPTNHSIKDGYNNGGYEWCLKNWGSKWGICRAELEEEDFKWGELSYTFESPWSPPMPVIIKMSEMFPTLTFELRYFEQGCEFNGILECKAGKITNEEQGKYFGNRGG